MTRPSCRLTALCALAAVLFFLAAGLSAQVARQGGGALGRLATADARLRPAPAVERLEAVQALLPPAVRDAWARFLADAGGTWQAYVDRRTDRLEIAEGSGIPWLPGPGNDLRPEDVAPSLHGGKADLATLEAIARAFLPRVAPLLGVTGDDLVLSRGRSGQPAGSLWLVDFDVRRDGRTIEGARVVFRVNNGNLVQLGSEGLPAAGAPAPQQAVDRGQALAVLAGHLGGFSAADIFLDGGSLHLLPAATADPGFAEGFAPGDGRGLVLAWQLVFRRKGETGTWRGRVDAATGKLLDFQDVNEYAKVTGGVYPLDPVDTPETVLPMPFADVPPVGNTNAAGIYIYPGGAVHSSLNGPYVHIFDQCGAISQAASGSGHIAFGTSGGTDCTTPGAGGAGNTHAARTQFYHLNRIKEIGRGWLPGNSWLNASLPAVVNLNQTCNAYWDGTAVNFFRSGGGCGNTGEIAGVSLHEYGHGLDQNDGNDSSPDAGTAESYADVTSTLVTHVSCAGSSFFGANCTGYGDACTACTGVRDVDWAKHASNAPHTVGNFTQPRCPFGGGYDGPCGREGHCESYVISEAVWDLAARDLPSPGTAAAWSIVERLWYQSRSTTGSAFTCHTATSPWTADGCAAGSLWRTFRAADDDDGNLANGTPHSCQLFAAFNRHGLACATDPGANVCFAACAPPAAPTVTLTPGDANVQVSWTSAGPGMVYDVFKNELGCSFAFLKVAAALTGTTFTDTAVANGVTYNYQVTAHPAGNEPCAAAPSTCQAATPQGPPCTPPAVPAGVAAQALGVGSIRVSWNAVAGASDYLILRATTAGGPYTQVADVGTPATSWTDTGLAEGTPYYYVVKAANEDCLSAAASEVSATTPVCHPVTLYSNDFESGSGLADWTVGSLTGASTQRWRGIEACTAHSGNNIFRFGDATCSGVYQNYESAYAVPAGATGIQVPAGEGRVRLSFWHRWSFEYGYDGGWLILAVDGGAFVHVPGSALIAGAGYTDGFKFTGTQNTFVNTVVDLDAACDFATGGSGGCAGHTLAIGFNANSDVSITYPGWFLDDVAVTACAAHGCTGAPVAGAAAVPGNNQVQVSWSNGAPPSAAFNVYRTLGTCAAPGAFEKVGNAVAGSPLLDTTVSGGATYAYRIAGLDPSLLCESDLSACVEAVATGACTLPPTFAGLAAVADAAQPTCALDLSWPAATARCGGPMTYDLYRSTDPNFIPGPASLAASGLSGTSYRDAGALLDSAPYTYVLRAVDAASGGADANTVRRSAAPRGPFTSPVTLSETFEGNAAGGGFDLGGWTHAALSGGVDWAASNQRSQSPTHSWYSASQSTRADRVLVSPTFVPRAGSALTFFHTFEFDDCFDGGTLETSTDHGAWTVVPDAAILLGGYTQSLYGGSPIGGLRAWCRGQLGAMTPVRVDLSAWAGAEVRVRWHAGEDGVIARPGWFLDDVTIADVGVTAACTSAPPPPLDFYTLPPCRLVDTRGPNGPLAGPALQPGVPRAFPLLGSCGVPLTAKAVSVNVTVFQPAAPGYLTVYPDGPITPATSTLNFAIGQTRANNAVLLLGDGTGAIRARAVTNSAVHFILDVNGYFQ